VTSPKGIQVWKEAIRSGPIVAGILAALSCTSIPPENARLQIEAERYATSHNVGGEQIHSAERASCGGSRAVSGLDRLGEYTQYWVTNAKRREYSPVLIVRGQVGVVFELELAIAGSGSHNSGAVFRFLGSGFG
jgi:hypothetical protein